MRIYDYLQYKPFLAELIASMPKKGRGIALKLSKELNVSSVVISQILKGDRHFTTEQGLRVANFFGLDERATDYFIHLISKERAGTHQLIKYHSEKIQKMREEESNVKSRMVKAHQLSDIENARFYSNWFYSGIRNLSSIKEYQTVDDFASYFRLSRAKTREVVSFLLQLGLCVEKSGKIEVGPTATYLDPNSPFANNHRRNWRIKSFEKMTEPTEQDLFYTSPMSLSAEDIKILRKEILAFVGGVSKRVQDSPSEKLACLNIDFFEF